jgi:NTE family protein
MKTVLVLSGGIALGAYQAGAYAALHHRDDLHPQHLAGSSVGAINAALIAGGSVEGRLERLQRFWVRVAADANPFVTPWAAPFFTTSWRHASSWMSALQTRFFGRSGLFSPRLPELLWHRMPSLYDLRPLQATLEEFIDFNELNRGSVRLSIATTDAQTGECVIFDTGKGHPMAVDHLLASCGLFPDFPPIKVAGRVLADGGFSANAPVEAVLNGAGDADMLCFVVDLFSAQGEVPKTLEQASSRQWELLFGNQSRDKLGRLEREYQLRRALRQLASRLGREFKPQANIAELLAEPVPNSINVFHLTYRPKDYEAGPEMGFDFSPSTLSDRWEAGFSAMERAIDLAGDGPANVWVLRARCPRITCVVERHLASGTISASWSMNSGAGRSTCRHLLQASPEARPSQFIYATTLECAHRICILVG